MSGSLNFMNQNWEKFKNKFYEPKLREIFKNGDFNLLFFPIE